MSSHFSALPSNSIKWRGGISENEKSILLLTSSQNRSNTPVPRRAACFLQAVRVVDNKKPLPNLTQDALRWAHVRRTNLWGDTEDTTGKKPWPDYPAQHLYPRQHTGQSTAQGPVSPTLSRRYRHSFLHPEPRRKALTGGLGPARPRAPEQAPPAYLGDIGPAARDSHPRQRGGAALLLRCLSSAGGTEPAVPLHDKRSPHSHPGPRPLRPHRPRAPSPHAQSARDPLWAGTASPEPGAVGSVRPGLSAAPATCASASPPSQGKNSCVKTGQINRVCRKPCTDPTSVCQPQFVERRNLVASLPEKLYMSV